jgi:HEAT repeat protein
MDSSALLRVLHDFHSGYLVLLTFVALGLLAGALYGTGVVGVLLWLFQVVVGSIVVWGFRCWRKLFAWAGWPQFLGMAGGLLFFGLTIGQVWPAAGIVLASALLYLGVTTCLACIFIDLERDEVARGYKALHKPLKGQALAENLLRYGHRVGVPLLIVATGGIIAGFALFNQGLYETVGRHWYSLGHGEREPGFPDFLAYTLINLFRVADLLNLANSYNKDYLLVSFVKQAKWPSSTLLALFQTFFSLVLLQQILSAIRKLKLLTQTISDFWSPHEPIRERASGSLPQYGASAVWPLLYSLRTLEVVTAEQRAAIPVILADIGRAAVPVLDRALDDPDENVRYVAVAALGRLHAVEALADMAALRKDRSDLVRQALAEALGVIAAADGLPSKVHRRPRLHHFLRLWLPRYRRLVALAELFRHGGEMRPGGPTRMPRRERDLDTAAVVAAALRRLLADESAAVRVQAARSLGLVGARAAPAVPALIDALKDADEAVRCESAAALGAVGAEPEAAVSALSELLADPSPALRAAVARALGAFGPAAEAAVPALVPLLRDHDEALRQAVAEAIGKIGTMQEDAVRLLGEGLASRDNMVRAQTAEVLGEIGPAAVEAAPLLVEALDDSNDRVRAKAVEALGRMGETAAEAVPELVPELVRALRDDDNWVCALAAEALGEIGNGSAPAAPALVRSLRHVNPMVRANAALALGKIGPGAREAVSALERAARDDDDAVRRSAVFALGEIGHLTPGVAAVLVEALGDSHPETRAAAAVALGKRPEWKERSIAPLVRALDDANDGVQLAATEALSRLADATPAVLDALCRLLEDDRVSVQGHAALALGRLGPGAAAAGPALLHTAQTGGAEVREQALRALALITPPEALPAFHAGLKDAHAEIRKIASAGLLMLPTIPPEAVPDLVDALRDPEVSVRVNAARALSRLEQLPDDAVPPLIEAASHADDGLRLNAALALRKAPPRATAAVFEAQLSDASPRLRLLAAGSLLRQDPTLAPAVVAVEVALGDETPRIRKSALELIDALGPQGSAFLERLRGRATAEVEPELSGMVERIVERLEQQASAAAEPPAAPAAPATAAEPGPAPASGSGGVIAQGARD